MEAAVMMAICKGQLPKLPQEESTAVDISPSMWSLMESCWDQNPLCRPSAKTLGEKVRSILDLLEECALTQHIPGIIRDS